MMKGCALLSSTLFSAIVCSTLVRMIQRQVQNFYLSPTHDHLLAQNLHRIQLLKTDKETFVVCQRMFRRICKSCLRQTMQKHSNNIEERYHEKWIKQKSNGSKCTEVIWRTWFFFSLQRTTLPKVPRPRTLKYAQWSNNILQHWIVI